MLQRVDCKPLLLLCYYCRPTQEISSQAGMTKQTAQQGRTEKSHPLQCVHCQKQRCSHTRRTDVSYGRSDLVVHRQTGSYTRSDDYNPASDCMPTCHAYRDRAAMRVARPLSQMVANTYSDAWTMATRSPAGCKFSELRTTHAPVTHVTFFSGVAMWL